MRILISVLLFIPIGLQAQNKALVDSLTQKLESADTDSLKIEIYHELFLNTYQYDPAAAKALYLEILMLANRSNNKMGMYKGHFGAAAYFTMVSQFDSALFYFKKAGDFADQLGENKLKIESLLAISHIHLWKNEIPQAKKAAEKSLELSEKLSDLASVALSFKNLGEIYAIENNLDSAIFSFLKTIKILEESGKEKSKLGDSYAGIGEIYMNLNNFNKALEFLDKSIVLFNDIGDYDGVMFASSMLGGLYFSHAKYDTAIQLLIPALQYYRSVGDPYRISETSRYLGLSYLNSNNDPEAEKNLSEAIIYGREASEPVNLADALMGYGRLLLKTKNHGEALTSFEEANDLYTTVNFIRGQIQSTQMLSLVNEETGNYKTSLDYLKKYVALKDSLNVIENAEVVQELEAEYQNEKKQQQIVLLEAQNKFREEETARQRNIFVLSISGALVIIFLLYILFRTHQKANKKLKELDTLKSRFFANISHEFRTPLTLISGPVEHRLSTNDLSTTEKEEFEMIDRNSKQLLLLVDQLLDLSKLESGGYQLKIRRGNIIQLIKVMTSSFHFPAGRMDIRYTVSLSQSSEEAWFDSDAIQKIVINLLSNAIKYTPEKGSIHFTSEISNGKLLMTCENSGAGIVEKDQTKIFERFFQQNSESGGAGIGLALVKELVDLLQGEIKVTSIPGQTTLFNLTIPVNKSAFKREQLFESADAENPQMYIRPEVVGKSDSQQEEITDDEQPILLIVDDNEDVRTFIKTILIRDYTILEANNGKKGVEMAVEHIPDIIISDIMMPETDGIALCELVKNDERTSHIPVILLTAKAGDENKLEGLKTGADDYITKPFNSEILKVRTKKLLELRQKLQARFSQEIILKPKDILITSADEKFLEKVQAILDTKLSDSNFSTESFSKEIGMSRMQLHRKLKALTGLSANHFIRNQRLILAGKLLTDSDINISEVGYLSGFSDPSYFSKCFKDHYRCTPSEYVNKNIAE